MAKKVQAMTRAYGGQTITISLDGKFHVDLDGDANSFDTMAAAERSIDRHTRAAAAVSKKKLSLAVVTEEGRPLVVTGIHSSTGKMLTNPKEERFSRADKYFADTPALRALLKEIADLEARVDELEQKRDGYIVNVKKTNYGGRIQPEQAEALTDELEKNYAAAVKGKADRNTRYY